MFEKAVQNALPLGVIGFIIYNTSVIQWELNKPGSRVCPKCANTRIAVGAGLAALAAYTVLRGAR